MVVWICLRDYPGACSSCSWACPRGRGNTGEANIMSSDVLIFGNSIVAILFKSAWECWIQWFIETCITLETFCNRMYRQCLCNSWWLCCLYTILFHSVHHSLHFKIRFMSLLDHFCVYYGTRTHLMLIYDNSYIAREPHPSFQNLIMRTYCFPTDSFLGSLLLACMLIIVCRIE